MNLMNSLNLTLLNAKTSSIYTAEDNEINQFVNKLIKIVGGVGAGLFTLAILIIAICIIFVSISPKNMGRWWFALFSCMGGAAVFFSAYILSDAIAGLF